MRFNFRFFLKLFLGCGFLLGGCQSLQKSDSSSFTSSNLSNAKGELDPLKFQKIQRRRSKIDSTLQEQLIQIRNRSSSAYEKVYAAISLGEFKMAESEARSLLRDKVNDGEALELLMAALILQKKYYAASYYAQRIQKLNIESSLAYNVIGISTLYYTGLRPEDYQFAQTNFERAIQLDSREVAAALNLATLFLEQSRDEEAARYFELAKGRCGGCLEALMGLGIAQFRSGSYSKARDSFQKVISLDPANAEARYRQALISREDRQSSDLAKKLLREILNDASVRADQVMKQRANTLLRSMEADRKGLGASKQSQQPSGSTEAPDSEILNEL